MPLPTDEKLIALSQDLLKQFDTIFGLHPGFRPAHARGVMLSGTFSPASEAASLTRAPHVLRDSTPVTARFSSSTGLPQIPDTDPNANPRGLAIRFHLAEHVHTDIVSHSTDGFPTRTGQEFLELLRAAASSDPFQPSPTPLEKFLADHPKALAFAQTPKPSPSSFARESYFGVTAMMFTPQVDHPLSDDRSAECANGETDENRPNDINRPPLPTPSANIMDQLGAECGRDALDARRRLLVGTCPHQ